MIMGFHISGALLFSSIFHLPFKYSHSLYSPLCKIFYVFFVCVLQGKEFYLFSLFGYVEKAIMNAWWGPFFMIIFLFSLSLSLSFFF